MTSAADTTIEVGGQITFRAITRHGAPTLTRKVIGFCFDRPMVRAHGYPDFVVRHDEITHVNGHAVNFDHWA